MAYPIDVELQAGLVLLADADLDDIPAVRRLWDRLAQDTSAEVMEGVSVRTETLARSGDDEPLSVRVYSADPTAGVRRHGDAPAVLLIHSGGFVSGSVATVHAEALRIAHAVQAVVVTVEYRLAPEHPYPAALNDCLTALRWMGDTASELGIDTDRIAVHGTSAGGALAVATTLAARDGGCPPVAFVHLNAPMLDDRLATASMTTFVDTPYFTRRAAEISWTSYLGAVRRGSAEVPVLAAPARATDLRGFPPTYVAVMQFDPLRDEGIAFAHRLLAHDVPVELHLFPQTFHGSSVLAHAEVSRRESAEEIMVLRKRLGTDSW